MPAVTVPMPGMRADKGASSTAEHNSEKPSVQGLALESVEKEAASEAPTAGVHQGAGEGMHGQGGTGDEGDEGRGQGSSPSSVGRYSIHGGLGAIGSDRHRPSDRRGNLTIRSAGGRYKSCLD